MTMGFIKLTDFIEEKLIFFSYTEMLSIIHLVYETKGISKVERDFLIEKIEKYYL